MLPFDERRISASLAKYLPLQKRGIPVPNSPKTLGEQLRKRRHELALHQSQAAEMLKVSERTLSLWEWDKVFPAWAYQPRLTEYLGHNPFTDTALARPLGNETQDVAVLSFSEPNSWGQKLKNHRLESRKTKREWAKKLGVSEKTLREWEAGKRAPTSLNKARLDAILESR